MPADPPRAFNRSWARPADLARGDHRLWRLDDSSTSPSSAPEGGRRASCCGCAPAIASVLSQIVDTLIFITVAFYGVFPIADLLLGQMLAKVVLSIVLVPLIYVFRRRSAGRQADNQAEPLDRIADFALAAPSRAGVARHVCSFCNGLKYKVDALSGPSLQPSHSGPSRPERILMFCRVTIREVYIVKKLILLCSTAVVMPTAAFAQSTGSLEFEKKRSSSPAPAPGRRRRPGARHTKAKAVLTQEMIRAEPGPDHPRHDQPGPGRQLPEQRRLRLVGRHAHHPRLSIRPRQPHLRRHPAERQRQLRDLLDQQLDPELIEQVNVNLGTTDVDSPTASAVGGTVNLAHATPSHQWAAGRRLARRVRFPPLLRR